MDETKLFEKVEKNGLLLCQDLISTAESFCEEYNIKDEEFVLTSLCGLATAYGSLNINLILDRDEKEKKEQIENSIKLVAKIMRNYGAPKFAVRVEFEED